MEEKKGVSIGADDIKQLMGVTKDVKKSGGDLDFLSKLNNTLGLVNSMLGKLSDNPNLLGKNTPLSKLIKSKLPSKQVKESDKLITKTTKTIPSKNITPQQQAELFITHFELGLGYIINDVGNPNMSVKEALDLIQQHHDIIVTKIAEKVKADEVKQ